MAGSATSYLQQHVLNHTLGVTAYAMPAGIFVGLDTTPPTYSTGGTEVTGGAYARQAATFAIASTSPNAEAATTATIQWPAATAQWGTIGWFELWDALTGGNRLYWGPLVDPADGVTPITRVIATGDIMRITAGALTVQAI